MTFADLNLNTPLLRALDDLGYTRPTTIQAKGFPVIMSGRDVVGIAQTGTGKTLAYLLPCLRQWQFSKIKVPTILVLVPTRELTLQVAEEARKLSAYMSVTTAAIYGGTNIKNQVALLNEGVDIIAATPGRLLELVMNGTLNLRSIKKLVIDEMDEMLNLGFRPQLTTLLDLLPARRQNLLFSATITGEVEALLQQHFGSPERIEAAPTGTPLENILQTAYRVPNFYTKVNLLELLLNSDPSFSKVLVFTATRQLADRLHAELETKFPGQAGILHSNKDQNTRLGAVQRFREGSSRMLIATDIVARGLDIAEVSHVINFDLPEVPENYIHRIGRTGRADRKGIAISFITEHEAEQQTAIEELMDQPVPVQELPSGLLISSLLTPEEEPKLNTREIRRKLPRHEPSGPAFHEKKEKNKKTNSKITRAEQMRIKYGKPKTRGDKRQNKK
jgi:ATP-dependent RNA helicase RhlE